MMSDIPFNINYQFDENLREVPENPDDMHAAIDYLETRLIEDSQDDYERMRLSGIVGALYRILGNYSMAEEHINSAIASSNNLRDRHAQLMNLIRLATVYHWRGDYDLADRIYTQVIMACEVNYEVQNPIIRNHLKNDLDAAYYNYAKCKFDQSDYESALHLFEKALAIREEKGEVSLIMETERAIQTTRKKLVVRN